MLSTFPQCTTDLPHASSETGQVYGLGPIGLRRYLSERPRAIPHPARARHHRSQDINQCDCPLLGQLSAPLMLLSHTPAATGAQSTHRSPLGQSFAVRCVFVGNHTSLYNALRIISHYSRNRHIQEIWPVHLLMPILSGYDTTQCQTPLLIIRWHRRGAGLLRASRGAGRPARR